MDDNDKIVLVKLYSGNMILGKKLTSNSDGMMSFTIALADPRVVVIAPTMTGSIRVALGTVCEPFKSKRLKEKIELHKSQVMFEMDEDEIDNELINGYKSDISGIQIASTSDITSVNSSNGSSKGFMQ